VRVFRANRRAAEVDDSAVDSEGRTACLAWVKPHAQHVCCTLALGLLLACASDGVPNETQEQTGGSSSTAVGGTGGIGGAGGSTSSSAAGGSQAPPKPEALTHYLTGNDGDAAVRPSGPGLILMGGGSDVDAAFDWWSSRISGGDVVVLRTRGSDGYNSYLYEEFGPVDSVETMLVTSSALANDPYVAWRIEHAEGIFMAGGDQATYLAAWKETALVDALHVAWARGAVLGGTSAGCAVLGEFVFAAYNGTVYSEEALADPYNQYMQLDRDFLDLAPLVGVITDTHFYERDRFGRLVGFLARVVEDGWATSALGLGVDERTALVVGPDGNGEVLGSGFVYAISSNGSPTTCEAGQALDYGNLSYRALSAGDTISLPSGDSAVAPQIVSASGGALSPTNPY
jgi:cyanophycinase